eukprot:RCo020226
MASLKRAALGRRALLTFPQPLCELGVPAMLRAVRPDWVTAVGLALAANSSSATVEWPYPAAPMQRRVPVVVHCIHNGLRLDQQVSDIFPSVLRGILQWGLVPQTALWLSSALLLLRIFSIFLRFFAPQACTKSSPAAMDQDA